MENQAVSLSMANIINSIDLRHVQTVND